MDQENWQSSQYASYSWHQSHDQATVLVMVPPNATEQDVQVVIEEKYLVASIRGRTPVVKGRLYGNIDQTSSSWKLESKSSKLSARERTISTTSTASTQSSYALVSDAEISSSFAASLESGHTTDAFDSEPATPSPEYASPVMTHLDDFTRVSHEGGPSSAVASGSGSPRRRPLHSFASSSVSSLDSPHFSTAGILLTIHLDKEQPAIWPSLITGPVPETLSPLVPVPFEYNPKLEGNFNMDPTSLVLLATELSDLRKDREGAFECLVRAWLQGRLPSATMKMVTHYLPLEKTMDLSDTLELPIRGTPQYYLKALGGVSSLARLYLDTGLLYLAGDASRLSSTSAASLSAIRLPPQHHIGGRSSQARRHDREIAVRFLDRAQELDPTLDVPFVSSGSEVESSPPSVDLQMPSLDINPDEQSTGPNLRRRRRAEQLSAAEKSAEEAGEEPWYMYLPTIVGAGTVLLVVSAVGAISFQSWRRNQSS